jgi:hypothetical protein
MGKVHAIDSYYIAHRAGVTACGRGIRKNPNGTTPENEYLTTTGKAVMSQSVTAVRLPEFDDIHGQRPREVCAACVKALYR